MFSSSSGTALLNLRRDAPLRPPNWRWLRAQALRAAGRDPSRILDDQSIVQAMDLQQAIEECGPDEWDRLELYDGYPSLLEALTMYEDHTDGGKARRWELEARLLCADAALEDTAVPMSMRPAAVAAYEALFFNVRDRLDARGWITQVAISPTVHTGVPDQEYGLVWKILGYCGGVKVLDDLLSVLGGTPVPDGAAVEHYYRDRGKALVMRRAIVAAMCLRVRDPYAKLQLMELSQKYQAIEQMAGGAAGPDEQLLEGMRTALEQVRFTMVEHGSPKTHVLPNGVELRAEQELQLGAGLPVDIPEHVVNAKFPEPRRHTDIGPLDSAEID